MPLSRRVPAVLAVAAMFVGPMQALVPASPASAAAGGQTFRMLTYNVAGLTETPFSEKTFGPLDAGQRAGKIGQRVLAGDYDVVAFNEAFDGDMKGGLFAILAPSYPFRITTLDVDNFVPGDSGLMLFSKFPFNPVPLNGRVCHPGWSNDATQTCTVAFSRFTSTTGDDKYANKGVAYTRLSNPVTGRNLNVFFSHAQADYDDIPTSETAGVRANQIAQIRNFMQTWAPVAATSGEETVLMGDLNVVGGSSEWTTQIAGVLGGIGMRDAWRTHTSPEDLGLSWSKLNSVHMDDAGEERLDYMLFRGTRNCFQHQTLERQFKEQISGGVTDLSDHFGVAALVGRTLAQCSPQVGIPPASGGALIDKEGSSAQSIAANNAFQWFRYNTPGTYSFQVAIQPSGPQQLELKFYDAADLSEPLTPFAGDGVFDPSISTGQPEKVVVSPNKPFYVRVRATSPTATGPYTFYAHRHTCTSFTEACQIDPFQPMTDTGQMTSSQANPSPAAKTYYRFRIHPLETFSAGQGTKQDLSFLADAAGGLKLSLAVFSTANTVTPLLTNGSNAAAFTDPASLSSPGFSQPANPASVIPGSFAEYYLVLSRLSGTTGTYTVNWSTNLSFVDLKNLRCLEQEDSTGDDDIWFNASIDGLPDIYHTLGEFDTNQGKNINWSVFPSNHYIAIADGVQVSLFEQDSNDPDDHLGTKTFGPPPPGIMSSNGWTPYNGDGANYRLSWREWRGVDD